MEQRENEFGKYCYQVKISGHLDESWATWLSYAISICEIDEDNHMPVTILTLPVTDQPALRGLLNKLFDLNLTLLSVVKCKPEANANQS